MNTTNDDPQGRPERDVRRHWNYRIIEFVDPTTNEPWRAIHEVHYCDGRPTIKPTRMIAMAMDSSRQFWAFLKQPHHRFSGLFWQL